MGKIVLWRCPSKGMTLMLVVSVVASTSMVSSLPIISATGMLDELSFLLLFATNKTLLSSKSMSGSIGGKGREEKGSGR